MKHHICMVSDFFYPNMGGVESHIFQLSQCLLTLGHKVVVITHSYGDKVGIRYLSNHLKVYYVPFGEMYNKSTLPTVYASFPCFRQIFIKESITIVHGHSAFSAMCHEALSHGKTIGLKTVFTDHSLFGFADISSILTNKLLELSLTDIDHVICVSNTSKENTVLRASLLPHIVSVIPNGVDANVFTPDITKKNTEMVTLVVVSRLVYRKGTDLLAGIIPIICNKYPEIQFIVGGDGPKRVILEELREKHGLLDRVTLLGELNHNQVRDVLVQGDIFINTSLTEAFCIAIVEAAACGLQVVSTDVGGVFEVLPPDMIYLAQPSIRDLVSVVETAIMDRKAGRFIDPWVSNERMKKTYTWNNVGLRTEKIYNEIVNNANLTIMERLSKFEKRGAICGKLYLLLMLVETLLYFMLEWLQPAHKLKDERKKLR